jgi:outer membrane protein assembly factor BamB
LVGTEDGKIAEENEAGDRTAKVWWRQRPVEIAANAVAVADRADLVRVVDLESGDTRWKHRLGGESSLTGDTPQVAVLPDALLLAVRRNHGVELDRLDPANGESVWTSGPAFLDADDVTLEHADADSELIVVPQGDSIAAISLETGRTLWRAELPETRNGLGWRVRIGRGCVIAYPEAAIPREPVADVFGRLRRSFEREPGLWRLPLILGGAYDAWVARSVPVVLLDPESGRRLVRFDIPAKGPAVAACFEGDRAVVATGDRVVWLR